MKITKQDKRSIQYIYNEILISNELTSLNDNQDLNLNITLKAVQLQTATFAIDNSLHYI